MGACVLDCALNRNAPARYGRIERCRGESGNLAAAIPAGAHACPRCVMRIIDENTPRMSAWTRAKAHARSMIALGLLFSATAPAANHVVTALPNLMFSPKTLTIAAGDSVTFTNGGGFHNVASDPGAVMAFRCAAGCDGAGGNGNLSSASWSATVLFTTPGTVRYFCERHGAAGGLGMSGTI